MKRSTALRAIAKPYRQWPSEAKFRTYAPCRGVASPLQHISCCLATCSGCPTAGVYAPARRTGPELIRRFRSAMLKRRSARPSAVRSRAARKARNRKASNRLRSFAQRKRILERFSIFKKSEGGPDDKSSHERFRAEISAQPCGTAARGGRTACIPNKVARPRAR